MYYLDFLSEGPKFYIFKEKDRKTNFGGVLFLIFIIIMFLISLVYIYSYIINDKYIMESMTYKNITNPEDIFPMHDNEDLNPHINFTIILQNEETYMNREFYFFDTINSEKLKPEFDEIRDAYIVNLNAKPDEFLVQIALKCEDENCEIHYDKDIDGEEIEEVYSFYISYDGFKINNADDHPIQKSDNLKFKTNKKTFWLTDRETFHNYDWEVIQYEEQESLLDSLTKSQKKYYVGQLKYRNNNYYYAKTKPECDDIELGCFLPLINIQFYNEHEEYILIKRKKIEFLDVLANIGGLFSTIKVAFAFILSFYSDNFDNYKILTKLLNNSMKNNLNESEDKFLVTSEKKKNINIDNIKIDNTPLINDDSFSNENNKLSINDIDNESCENKNKDENKGKNNSENNCDSTFDENEEDDKFQIPILNKLSCWDFFLNNIYCKSCIKIKRQEKINLANELNYNYLSKDSLLYNQLKLENLFRDYKWNDPSLNDINNNICVKKLKKSLYNIDNINK